MQDKIQCRICYQRDPESELINPCDCTGTMGLVHQNCLKTWIMHKQHNFFGDDGQAIKCEMCDREFRIVRKSMGFIKTLKNVWKVLYKHNFFLFKGTLYSVYLYMFGKRTAETVKLIWSQFIKKKLHKPTHKLFFSKGPSLKRAINLKYPMLESLKFMYYLVILLQLLLLWRNDLQRIRKFFRRLQVFDFMIMSNN